MKLPLVGPTYQSKSLPFDAQRCVNLYPEISESQTSVEPAMLVRTPGLVQLVEAGGGPIRGMIATTEGDRLFAVSGGVLYEVDSSGAATNRGSVSAGTEAVSMATNGTEIFIAQGATGWIYNLDTDTLSQITDPDFPGAETVAFIDGYFVFNAPNSGKWYVTSLYNGGSVDALDFVTSESKPDLTIAVIVNAGQVWTFGSQSTEVYYNSGGADFPFSRLEGAVMEVGCAAAHSVVRADNSLFWLGRDEYGAGMVYRAVGYKPLRISTHAIENKILACSDLSQFVGFVYQRDGHTFYFLTHPQLETTLVYDAATNMWHERAYLDEFGMFAPHRANCAAFFNGWNVVGDRSTGQIYRLDADAHTDAGNPIRWLRVLPHTQDQLVKIRSDMLRINMEVGTGLVGGDNPTIALRISNDAGRTWSSEIVANVGKVGQYDTTVEFRRLGISDHRLYELSGSDPVRTFLYGAYLTARAGK